MQWMIWVWLGIIVMSLIIEFVSISMTSLWFAIGGLVSLVLASVGVGVIWQIVVFAIISFVCLLSLRKVALKFLYRNKDDKTNKDAIIGRELFVNEEITEQKMGTVKIDGVVWSCISSDPKKEIKSGAKVIIKEIKGNKFVVEEIEDPWQKI